MESAADQRGLYLLVDEDGMAVVKTFSSQGMPKQLEKVNAQQDRGYGFGFLNCHTKLGKEKGIT